MKKTHTSSKKTNTFTIALAKYFTGLTLLGSALVGICSLPAWAASATPSPAATTDKITITSNAGSYKLQNNLGTLIGNGLQLVYTVAALLLLVYLLWGGIDWLTAGGDSGKVDAAVAKIRNALIGLVSVAASWAIFRLTLDIVFGLSTSGNSVDLGIPNLGG